jgi:hypothetical protein
MFTQCYFIRKNSPELKKKLEEFGYIHKGYDKISNKYKSLYTNYNSYFELSVDNKPSRYENIIDCGINEELFLALAALRDDTDKNQWFICKEEYLGNNLRVVPVGEWQKNMSMDKLTYSLKKLWRKATVKEIIEHFSQPII